MNATDIYKIKSNDVTPSRGKVLISEPFLIDATFGRSVILLIDHSQEGSMGIVLNKPLPLNLNQVISDFRFTEEIPLFKGGPLSTDTLFYIHTLSHIAGSLPVSKGLYMNGDFDAIKRYILEGNPVKGHIKFFLGYSGWDCEQLFKEIEEDTWMVGKENIPELLANKTEGMWKLFLGKLGFKYERWSRFPQVPALN